MACARAKRLSKVFAICIAAVALAAPVAYAAGLNTVITAGPSGQVTTGSVTFEFAASQKGARFRCSMDGAAYTACTSGKTYKSLGPGRHTFSVKAVRRSRADRTPATRRFSVADATASGATGPVGEVVGDPEVVDDPGDGSTDSTGP